MFARIKRARFDFEDNENQINTATKKFGRSKNNDWSETVKTVTNFVRTFPPEKFYIVQYDKVVDKQIKQMVINAKDTVVSGFNDDCDITYESLAAAIGAKVVSPNRLQQVFISDEGFVRAAYVIDEANTYEKACERLQQLKKECYDMLFKRPESLEPVHLPIFTVKNNVLEVKNNVLGVKDYYILIQYKCDIDKVIYGVERRSKTAFQHEHQINDLVVYIFDNGRLYHAMVIKSSHNPFELIEDLKILANKCIRLKIIKQYSETIKAMSLEKNTAAAASPFSQAIQQFLSVTLENPLQTLLPMQKLSTLPPKSLLKPLAINPLASTKHNGEFVDPTLPTSTEILKILHREQELEHLNEVMHEECTELINIFNTIDVIKSRMRNRINYLNRILEDVKARGRPN